LSRLDSDITDSTQKEDNSMTVHPNVQLLRDYFVAQQRSDKDTLATQFTADARWWAPVSAEQRGLVSRPLEGGAEVVEMLIALVAHLYGPDRDWTVQHVIADDETGAAHAELVTTVAGSGQVYRNEYAFFYRFVNGQIAEVWEFTDTDYAYGLFGEAIVGKAPAHQ
jgi:ketosteroid isomerase-like protein